MPLRVQCPNGCVMRVPSNRAGMSARCPGCKTVVVVPFPPGDYRPTDLLLAPAASSAITSSADQPAENQSVSSVTSDRKKTESRDDSPKEPANKKLSHVENSPESSRNANASLTSEDSNRNEPSDSAALSESKKSADHAKTKKKSKRRRKKKKQPEVQEPAAIIETEPQKPVVSPIPDEPDQVEAPPSVLPSMVKEGANPSFDVIKIELESEDEPRESKGVNPIEVRTRRANEDRVTLTRFFAGFLIFVGLVNLAPAIYCWYSWAQLDPDFIPPRWIYLQIFIAVLHMVYAVMLLQVPDWSTLRSIAIVMLSFAFIFGLFSMGLLVSGRTGMLAQFLQIPSVMSQQACIWCVAMLCLATLASYLAGRESSAWQRTEQLLAEIMAKKETAET